MQLKAPPPRPILQKVIDAYKIWHAFLNHLDKLSRYTIGVKINNLFLELIEIIYFTTYTSEGERALLIKTASSKLDSLKLFIRLSWEIKALDNKKYAVISIPLAEIGKMIGGWKKQLFE